MHAPPSGFDYLLTPLFPAVSCKIQHGRPPKHHLRMLSMQQPMLRPRAAIAVPFGRGAGQQKVIRHSFLGKSTRRVAGRCVVTPQASASAQVSSTIKMSVQGRHLEVTPALGCAAALHDLHAVTACPGQDLDLSYLCVSRPANNMLFAAGITSMPEVRICMMQCADRHRHASCS